MLRTLGSTIPLDGKIVQEKTNTRRIWMLAKLTHRYVTLIYLMTIAFIYLITIAYNFRFIGLYTYTAENIAVNNYSYHYSDPL